MTKPVKVTIYVDPEVYSDLIASSNRYDRSPGWLLERLWVVRPSVSAPSPGRRRLTRKVTAYMDPTYWEDLQGVARRYERTPSWLLDCTWRSLRAEERHEVWTSPVRLRIQDPAHQHEAAP